LASGINYLITKKRLEMMPKKTSKLKEIGNSFLAVCFSLLLFLSFSVQIDAQNSGASKSDLEKYAKIMDKITDTEGNFTTISKNDAVELESIWKKMSEVQKKNHKRVPPPPPLPPPPPKPTKEPSPIAPPAPPKPSAVPEPVAAPAPPVVPNSSAVPVIPKKPKVPPPPPLPPNAKYVVDGKNSTYDKTNKLLKSGKVHKVKTVKNAKGVEYHVTTSKKKN
jgi:hypothetical protein